MQHCVSVLVFTILFVYCPPDAGAQNFTSKCGGKEKASNILNLAKDFVSKAKNLYPNCEDEGSNCGQKEKSDALLDVAMNLITQVSKNYPNCSEPDPEPEPECPKYVERPMDCSEILLSGKTESGVYTIWPRSRISTNKSITVYCDMDTEGGGWTVIQRRGNFSTPKDYFYKDWQSYKKGFGNIKEEFWIGNDNIYAISNQASYTLRFDLEVTAGDTGYAEYSSFWIDDETTNYTLHIDGYSGNAGNAMNGLDNMKFTTKDRQNDEHTVNCALDKQGAWWFKACTWANLNGINTPGVESRSGITWYQLKNSWISLEAVEIKLRPQ